MLATIASHSFVTLLGSVGLYMVEVSYLPQLWRLYRLKEADEFSFLFPGLNIVGRLAGLYVAIATHSPQFGWFFVVGIILRLALMSEVVYYRSRSKRRGSEGGVAIRAPLEAASTPAV